MILRLADMWNVVITGLESFTVLAMLLATLAK